MTTDTWTFGRPIVALVAVANVVPLLGVFGLGWGLTELLLLYWLEWVVAVIVGLVKTAPARLVTLPLPDSRRTLSIWIRRGTVTSGIPCYVRNGPWLLLLVCALGVWLVTGWLVFDYGVLSVTATIQESSHLTIVPVASLLVLSQLVTLHPYVTERRYDRLSATKALGPSLAYTLGMCALVGLLFLGDTLVDAGWLAVVPVVIVVGKITLELLLRCRQRRRFERIDRHTDPFATERTRRQRLSPTRFTAELPPVDRPSERPHTTIRSSRSAILVASPFAGLANYHGGQFFGVFFGLAAVIVVLGGPMAFGAVIGGVAVAGVTLCGLLITVPTQAPLEYEFYDDQLVCYDHCLEEPQWRLSYAAIDTIRTHRSRVGRIAGYETVVVETSDDHPARLPYLRDPNDVADPLEQASRLEAQ